MSKYDFNPFTGNLDKVYNSANEIDITDAGDYFTGTEVETALQEIGDGTTLDNRYLQISNNLSDVANAGTARTNLGLVAGGAGDIWVEKAGDTMTGRLDGYILYDTKANIQATTPAGNTLAFATDTEQLYLYDGSNWKKQDIKMQTDLQAPDMGYESDTRKSGIHEDWITDKQLSNITIGGSSRTDNGGLRIDVTQDPDTLEVYLRSVWNTIIYDLTTEDGDFRHVPIGEEIYVWRGDSVALGLNGRPQIQEYNVSMGANPPAKLMYGGSF